MAIIVEDGTKVAGANSFILVADCKTYLDLRGETEWGLLVATITEPALIKATDFLEQRYRLKWKGEKKTKTQVLSWPRKDVTDEDGFQLTSTTIPQELIDAQCLLALRAVDAEGELVNLTTDVTQDNLVKKSKDVLDVLETEREYFQQISQTFYQEVDDLLLPWLDSVGIRAVRG